MPPPPAALDASAALAPPAAHAALDAHGHATPNTLNAGFCDVAHRGIALTVASCGCVVVVASCSGVLTVASCDGPLPVASCGCRSVWLLD